MEEEVTDIESGLESSVEVKDWETKQASFKCKKNGLDQNKVYSGLKLNSSEEITGIPSDGETLLNPDFSENAIANRQLKDSSKSEVPSSFEFHSIDTQTYKDDGKFLLKGKFDKEITNLNKFTIPLTFPP